MKIRRNDPCPCGSGKKYKRCCLRKLEDSATRAEQTVKKPISIDALEVQLDALDDMSNRVLDLIDGAKLSEAENLCRELRRIYPDQIDWIERSALLHKAKGDFQRAAEYFRKAAAFAQSNSGFDPDYVEQLRQDAQEMDQSS